MDIKINQIQQTVPPETTEQIQQTDDKFKMNIKRTGISPFYIIIHIYIIRIYFIRAS